MHYLPIEDQGCYQEGTDGRALTGNAFVQDNMTVEICQTLCNGTRFYGLEYGNQCYCGTKLDNDAYQVPDSSCAIPCSGDTTKTCGGLSLLSLYRNNFTSQFPAYDYVEKGCYREPSDHRALTRVLTSNLMTRTKVNESLLVKPWGLAMLTVDYCSAWSFAAMAISIMQASSTDRNAGVDRRSVPMRHLQSLAFVRCRVLATRLRPAEESSRCRCSHATGPPSDQSI